MKNLLAAVTVLTLSTAQAVVIHVDADNCPGPGNGSEAEPYCSIQTAIDNAVDMDEIVVAPGTYLEAINFLAKAITLRSFGGAAVTTIDGTGNFHVVQCVSGEGPDTVLYGFTITGGNAVGMPGPDELGGGMFNVDSSPSVTNCAFTANAARSGGGMYNHSGSPIVVNCVFTDNTADANDGGGGMYNAGGSALVISCRFTGNTAGFGGAMMNLGSLPTLVNCLFAGNTAQSGAGGAIANFFSKGPAVINCTFAGNTASQLGGAIFDGGGNSAVANSVLWMNEPDQILVDPKFPFTTVSHSTVQGGYAGPGNIDADPLFVDPDNGDYRLSSDSSSIDAGDNTAFDVNCGDCDQPDPDGLPGCSDLTCEAKVCQLYPFCCDSEWDLFCAGKAESWCHCMPLPAITTDLDGNPRFLDIPETPDTGNPPGGGPIVDMGAYESLGGGCLAVISQEVVCHADGTTFTVNIEGLNACTGGTTQVTFTASGGAVGEELCFTALVSDGGFCCSTEICVTIPDCTPAALSSDLDGDGIVGLVDFLALLADWGTCSDCGAPQSCPADFDGDCSVGILDLLILLGNWS